ncbi:hypothetical protein FA15DRAFT_665803 [Coprinopsis marcescibilis]|uniref:Mitochondrial ribosomal protein subunit L20 n=1 Tax=Coprinopsis marcescibilis TaxID=230819 RepID=A0A5C3L648_COPMA|nr:hypothetical protein FA15DRAFT_665803 [Coprinopsis marcescibilis]
MLTASKRALQLSSSFIRTYATRHPRPRPGTSERPPAKHKDPLTSSASAHITELEEDGLTFIHRPPPSAPSPASLTTAPSSPLLQPAAPSPEGTALPPLLRKEKPQPQWTPVSPENIEKMKELRASDPVKYSTNKLAEMFGCSRMFITLATRISTKQLTALRRTQATEHEEHRARWSDRHKLVKAVRVRQRQHW